MAIIFGIAAAALTTGILSSFVNTPVITETEAKTYTVIEEKGITGTHNEEKKA